MIIGWKHFTGLIVKLQKYLITETFIKCVDRNFPLHESHFP